MKSKHVGALALMATGALAGQAQAQVTIYGLVDAAVQTTSGQPGGQANRLISGGIQGSRYGFKGSEDLGGGLKVVFELENQFAVDTGANKSSAQSFSRKALVGLSGDFGKVTVGRQTTVSYDAQSDLDPVQFANFTPLGNSGDAPALKFADYQVVNARRDNAVKYSLETNGLLVGAMVALGEQAGSTRAGSSLGLRVGYSGGGFSAQAAYDETRDNASAKATGLTLGGSYTLGDFTAYLGTAQVKNDFQSAGGFGRKNTVWWLGGRYALTPQFALHLAYYDQKQTGTTNAKGVATPDGNGKARTYSLLADYLLSKRSDVYIALQSTQLKDGMIAPMAANGTSSTVTTVLAGMRHKF